MSTWPIHYTYVSLLMTFWHRWRQRTMTYWWWRGPWEPWTARRPEWRRECRSWKRRCRRPSPSACRSAGPPSPVRLPWRTSADPRTGAPAGRESSSRDVISCDDWGITLIRYSISMFGHRWWHAKLSEFILSRHKAFLWVRIRKKNNLHKELCM